MVWVLASASAGIKAAGRRIADDRRGATAVEFGLIGTPFLLTLFAVFEIGYSFYLSTTLDYAAQAGARAVGMGTIATAKMSASDFKTQILCPKLSSVFSCSNVFVNMTVVPAGQNPTGYYSYVNAARSALNRPALDSGSLAFCPGAGTSLVTLQVLYPASFFTSFFSSTATTTFNGVKTHVLMSTVTFKSEPYAGAQAYSGC